MQSSLRTPYDRVVMAVPVAIPYVRYSIESAQWWIGRALKSLVDGAGITPRDIDGFCVSSFTAGRDSWRSPSPRICGRVGRVGATHPPSASAVGAVLPPAPPVRARCPRPLVAVR